MSAPAPAPDRAARTGRRRAVLTLLLLALLELAAPREGAAQAMRTGAAAAALVASEAREQNADNDGRPDTNSLHGALAESAGCLGMVSLTTAYTVFWAGPAETIMVVAGGLVLPGVNSAMLLALATTTAAGTCSIGALAMPFLGWTYEQGGNILAHLGWRLREARRDLAELLVPGAVAAPRLLATAAE